MRTCWAARNRNTRQCTRPATHGDYCILHISTTGIVAYTRQPTPPRPPGLASAIGAAVAAVEAPAIGAAAAAAAAATTIARAWRQHGPRLIAATRGPYSATWGATLATNTEEFASFDSLDTIPPPYRFTYVDPATHTLWWFDIRSLAATPRRQPTLANPYTRSPFPPAAQARFETRMEWLRQRRYNRAIPPPTNSAHTLTAKQRWSLRILEVFYNFDQLGFAVSPAWFEELTPPLHTCLRFRLEELWRRRVSPEQREAIVPGITALTGGSLFRSALFPGIGGDIAAADTLNVFEQLLTASADKTQRVVGALYCIAALTVVCPAAHQTYPWLLPSL